MPVSTTFLVQLTTKNECHLIHNCDIDVYIILFINDIGKQELRNFATFKILFPNSNPEKEEDVICLMWYQVNLDHL